MKMHLIRILLISIACQLSLLTAIAPVSLRAAMFKTDGAGGKHVAMVDFSPPCVPDVVVRGMMEFLPVEGSCWAFRAEDGIQYEPLGGPAWMYVNGLSGVLYGAYGPWPSICMVGTIVEVCGFEADGCTDNLNCYLPGEYCAKPRGDCSGVGICDDRPQVCIDVYDPVCGCDGFTYGNECEAAMEGVSINYQGPCEAHECQADHDHNGIVDSEDLRILAGEFANIANGAGPSFWADADGDHDVDGSDLTHLVFEFGRSDCLVPRIMEYSNNGCLPGSEPGDGSESYPACGEDQIVVAAGDHSVDIIHRNATYNCCPDDIKVSLAMEGGLLRLTETEITSTPCDCLCCYDIYATVVDLAPGNYLLEFCWDDYETGQQCYWEEIIMP